MTTDEVLSRFDRVGKCGKGWSVKCPAHDDRNASLSIGEGDDGRILLKCHTGCSGEEVVAALGIDMKDLFAEPAPPPIRVRRIVASHEYQGADGTLLYVKDRWSSGAKCSLRRPDGKGGWIHNLNGQGRVLYRLPYIVSSSPEKGILLVEGEKAADAGARLGLLTTTSGGVDSWRDEFAPTLAGRDVVILPDNDDPGRKYAQKTALSLDGIAKSVRIVELPDLPPKGDLFDWIESGGTAEELGRFIEATEQAQEPGALAALLGEIAAFLSGYMVFSKHECAILSLWVLHTHAFAGAEITPYLNIYSPEPLCGKTTLLDLLAFLVARPWLTGRVTAAVLVRKVDRVRPTLLLDEGDAAFSGEKEYAEALRGLLNSGYKLSGAASLCVGQGANIDFKDFSTFCPKAIAGIGDKLPDTVRSRSIPIALGRKKPGERRKDFRERDTSAEARPLRERAAAWATPATVERLRQARPEIPEGLHNRAKDVSEPLFALADEAGGSWPELARRAAVALLARNEADESSHGARALADIRNVFAERQEDRLPSAELVAALNGIETSPWADWSRGRCLTPTTLSRLLRLFGIAPRNIKIEGGRVLKGYHREQFAEAWERYLPAAITPEDPLSPSSEAPGRYGATDAEIVERESPSSPATDSPGSGSERPISSNNDAGSSAVATETRPVEREGDPLAVCTGCAAAFASLAAVKAHSCPGAPSEGVENSSGNGSEARESVCDTYAPRPEGASGCVRCGGPATAHPWGFP
jgi:hypothetical protein